MSVTLCIFARIDPIMRKLLIALLMLGSLPLLSQEDTLNRLDPQGQKTGYWIRKDAEGRKLYEGYFAHDHPMGNFKRYHPDGKVKAAMVYDSTGRFVDARLYDEAGRLRASGKYVDQKRDGLWNYLSEKGLPIYNIHYHQGQLSGQAIRFDAAGRPLEQTNWVDGTLHGEQLTFHPDGKIQSRIQYIQGKMDGEFLIAHSNGKPEITGRYLENLKEGPWTYFKPDGQVDFILEYQGGRLLNPGLLDQRQQEAFDRYERSRNLILDPEAYRNNPNEYLFR